jgi:hypothetical protein
MFLQAFGQLERKSKFLRTEPVTTKISLPQGMSFDIIVGNVLSPMSTLSILEEQSVWQNVTQVLLECQGLQGFRLSRSSSVL